MTTGSRRLTSVDAFRAITMLLMIFVNDLVLVNGVPSWLEHAGETEDRLGLADTVFPAFLFIVGLSIPFAIRRRAEKGFSRQQTFLHILLRSLSLLLMGFFQVNYEEYNNTGAVIPKYVWLLVTTIGLFLVWLDYPPGLDKRKKMGLRGGGILLLAAMALLYHGGTPEEPAWMGVHWYGILGLIGWSYGLCALVYLLVEDRWPVLATIVLFFLGFNIADTAGWLDRLQSIREHVWLVGSGSLPAMTMAGVLVAVLYRWGTEKGKGAQMLGILLVPALVLLAAGLVIRPLGGISKLRATPSWTMICIALSIASFVLLAFIMDIKGYQRWYEPLRPAGTSALTAYLLTYLHFAIFRLLGEGMRLPPAWRAGGIGIAKSIVFACLIVWITGRLEKRKIRLSI